MRLRDMIAMSLSNLWKRKVRTLLTVTGVVIGTCAIVVMISLGLGMQKTMQDSLAQMGDLTIISIYNYGSSSSGSGSDKPALDDSMLDTIRQLKYVQAVTPAYNPNNWNAFTIKSGKYQYSGQITGVDFDALKLMGYEMQEGQMPDSTTGYEGVVVFGSSAGYDFYNPKKNNWWNDRSGDPPVNVMEDKLELTINKDDGTASKAKAKKITCTGIMVEDWSRNPSPYGVFMDVNYLRSLEKEYNKLNNVKEDTEAGKVLEKAITDFCAARSSEEAEAAFVAAGLPCSRILRHGDMLSHPHYIARESITNWERVDGTEIIGQNVTPKLKNNPGQIWRGCPTVGMDNEDILREAGFDEDYIRSCYEDGTITKK